MSDTPSRVIPNDIGPKKELRECMDSVRRCLEAGHRCAKSTRDSLIELHERTSAARSEMKAFISSLQEQLVQVTLEFEENIDCYLKCEDAIISRRLSEVTMMVAAAESKKTEIQSVIDNVAKCRTYGTSLISSCESFFEKSFKTIDKINAATEEYGKITFVPRCQGTVSWEEIGYIKYSELDPMCTDVIVNVDEYNQVTAKVGDVEMVLIHTNLTYSRHALNYIIVNVTDPNGVYVPTIIEDNRNGSYFVLFTPLFVGLHVFQVKIFGVDVKDSPIEIRVTKKLNTPAAVELKSRRNSESGHVAMSPAVANSRDYHLEPRRTNDNVISSVKVEEQSARAEQVPLRESRENNERRNVANAVDRIPAASDRWFHYKTDVFLDGAAVNYDWNGDSYGFYGGARSVGNKSIKSELCDGDGLRNEFGTDSNGSGEKPRVVILDSNDSNPYGGGDRVLPARLKPWSELVVSKCDSGKSATRASHEEIVATNNANGLAVEFNQHRTQCFKKNNGTSGLRKDEKTIVEFNYDPSDPHEAMSNSIVQDIVRVCDQAGDTSIQTFITDGRALMSNLVLERSPLHYVEVQYRSEVYCSSTLTEDFTRNGEVLLRPSAVVVNKKEDIFVKYNYWAVYVFGKDGGGDPRAIGLHQLQRPYGLALNNDDNLMIFDHGNRNQSFLCTFSQDGALIRRSPYGPLAELAVRSERQKSKCRSLACHGDFVYVVDLGRSVVYKTDKEGRTICTFGSFGRNWGAFNEPSGITIDSNGNLLIADSRNNRIQMFNADGHVMGYVKLAQEIIRPSGIHLTDDNLLLVSNYLQNCVKVFKILPPP